MIKQLPPAKPIAELPDAEQVPFRAWMRGQTITVMPGASIPKPGYYCPQDSETWQREWLSPFVED